ncbi:MAG: rhodanese-like domain-containing protein [Deltaproteobacteria bacterium]|nr:rhodanese-like domain-containing protein [Deltaproteobacteria bacterium]
MVSVIALSLLLACGGAPPAPPRSTPAEPTALVPTVITPAEAQGRPGLLVDVRPAADFAAGHVPGAVSLPFSGLDPYQPPVTGWSKDLPLLVMSERNRYGAVAAQLLAAAGYRAQLVEGGAVAWQGQGLPWEAPIRSADPPASGAAPPPSE